MSGKWPGGIISKTAPTVTGPTDGEGGSASGIWTLDQAAEYEKQGLWPKLTLPREILGWGSNYKGQLGQGTSGPAVPTINSPVQVGAYTNWSVMTKTSDSVTAINALGEMWAWGKNYYGQLGTNNTTYYSSPVQVGALTTWSGSKSISAGLQYIGIIKSDGTLWTWGNNSFGQIGNGTVGPNYSSPIQVGFLTDWSTIGNAVGATYVIKTDGTLWVCGEGSLGGLGLGNTTSYSSPVQLGALTDWAQVKGGNRGCMAVKTDGTLWGWGRNANGEVGSGNTTVYSSPVQIGALTDWLKVVNSYKSTLALKTDGTLWAWGKNDTGQLGVGDTTDRSSPVQIGALTTWTAKISNSSNSFSAIKADGTWWGWGSGNDGILGMGNSTNYSSPVQHGALTTWLSSALGSTNSTFFAGFKQP